MRLTPAGKFLLFVVGLGVLGYAGWTYRRSVAAAASRRRARRRPPLPRPAYRRAAPAARRGVLASIRQSGVMRVGMEPDAPPLHFINARKQEDGFDFRLAAHHR